MSEKRAPLTEAEKEAGHWIARLEASDVTLDDHKRFREWLNASAENRTAYEALNTVWDKLDLLKTGYVSPSVPARRQYLVPAAVAACALMAITLFASWSFLFPPGVAYATEIGESRVVTLADGTTAELSAATRLRASLEGDTRRVWLDAGEALFDVAHAPERPFIVETKFGRIRVTGTAFTVEILRDRVRATVLRGSVRGEAGGEIVAASPNDEITLNRAGAERAAIAPESVEQRLAWREGILAFDGETLSEAALEIERHTGVRFHFADRSIGDVRVGGYINATDTDAFIALLESNLGLSARRRSDGSVELTRSDTP